MKHASSDTLKQLEPLLVRIRALDALVERKPGTFYRKSAAFLHFHEDSAGLFADAKLNGVDFERLAVSTEEQREAFWSALLACTAIQASAGHRKPGKGGRGAA